MKKKLSLLLSALFALSLLGGCGEVASDSRAETSSDSGELTVISPDRPDPDSKTESAGISETVGSLYTETIILNESNDSPADTSELYSDIWEDDETETESETESSTSETSAEVSVDSAAVSQVFYPEDASETTGAAKKTVTVTVYTRAADVSRRAKEIVSEMSDSEKAAQLILARCPQSDAAELMEDYSFGGYVLFASDFENREPDTAGDFITEIKKSAMTTPLIAVDEEGGTINRVSKFDQYRSYPFLSPGEIYSESGIDGLYSDASEKADLLLSLGINMNLGPVADVASSGDYIYPRIISEDYSEAGAGAAAIINASGEKGLISCLKHFPGYGANVDTHTGISLDTRSLDEFRKKDFIPFEKALEADYTPAVMINHNVIECIDDELPASVSPGIHKILRDELGFEGVIITDDLGMDGIKAYTGSISPYVMGIFAGNDLLCVSDPITAYNDIINAIDKGYISQKILDRHVERIIQMKLDYDIIE